MANKVEISEDILLENISGGNYELHYHNGDATGTLYSSVKGITYSFNAADLRTIAVTMNAAGEEGAKIDSLAAYLTPIE